MAERGNPIELFGVKELDAFFRSMSRADQYKLLMKAYEKVSRPLTVDIRNALKARLNRKKKQGNLNKSIGFVRGSSRSKLFVTARIGARKFGQYKGFHGHLVDAGTVERQTKRGFNRGRMPGNKFFTDTVEQRTVEISDDLRTAAMESLEIQIQKLLTQHKSKFA